MNKGPMWYWYKHLSEINNEASCQDKNIYSETKKDTTRHMNFIFYFTKNFFTLNFIIHGTCMQANIIIYSSPGLTRHLEKNSKGKKE